MTLTEHAQPLILLGKIDSCSSVPAFISKGGNQVLDPLVKFGSAVCSKKFFSTLPDVYLFKTWNIGTKRYFYVKFQSIYINYYYYSFFKIIHLPFRTSPLKPSNLVPYVKRLLEQDWNNWNKIPPVTLI